MHLWGPVRRESVLTAVVGILKAYSELCVGEGPFTCEFFGDEADKLREAGGEYGAATGRPRRVGGFDAVASRYGVVTAVGATEVALTKLDVLSCFDRIPVCTAYEIDGEKVYDFPTGERLNRAKPVYGALLTVSAALTYPGAGRLPGCQKPRRTTCVMWKRPQGARISYVSVGAKRDEYIKID